MRRLRSPFFALIGLTVGGLLFALPAGGSAAAESAGGDVTWAVNPVPAADGSPRAWSDLTLDPGESASDAFQVRNFSDTPVTFAITAADGYFNERGRFNMLPADQESVDAGVWIDVQKSVTVGVNETVEIPFTVEVPRNATPGDHAAGIAASVSSTGRDEGGNSIGVESRIGFRVLTRVTGELAPSFVVDDVQTDYRTNWNPLEPGSMNVSFLLRNTGNLRLMLAATVVTGLGPSAEYAPAPGERALEFLPGDERRVTLSVTGVWPTFAVPGDLTVSPQVVAPDDETDVTVAPATESFVGWAMPWPQLLVLLGVALIIGGIVWDRIRGRRRLRQAVAAAREDERSRVDAPASLPGPPL